MEKWLSPIFPTFSFAAAVSALMYAAFVWANKTASSDIRDRTALWILGEPGKAPWLEGFTSIFYALFGKKQLSRRGTISLVVTTLLVASMAFIWLHYFDAIDADGRPRFAPGGVGAWDIQLFLLIVALYAIPLQFLAMGVARFFIGRFATSRRLLAPIALFLLIYVVYVVVSRLWLIVLQLPYFALRDTEPFIEFMNNWYGPSFAMQIEYSNYLAPGLIAAAMPLVFMLAAISIAVLRRVYLLSNRTFQSASKFLSKERIEKEPILLVGEVVVAATFLSICILGL